MGDTSSNDACSIFLSIESKDYQIEGLRISSEPIMESWLTTLPKTD